MKQRRYLLLLKDKNGEEASLSGTPYRPHLCYDKSYKDDVFTWNYDPNIKGPSVTDLLKLLETNKQDLQNFESYRIIKLTLETEQHHSYGKIHKEINETTIKF